MRVLMVHDEPVDRGYGAEAYVRRLVTGLREAGDEVELVAGEVSHHGLGRLRDGWDPAARRLVDRRARGFSPDVVHLHNIARELSPSVLGSAPGVPAVMTVHDLRLLGGREHSPVGFKGMAERAVAQRIRRLARRRLAATVGVSDRVAAALREAAFPAVSTVRVPVAEPAVPPTPVAQCRDVAIVARLAPDKGVDVALRAFRTLADSDSRLLIAGDGPLRGHLERQAAGLGDRVRFLGRLDEAAVSELLGRVRAVVVASQASRRPEGSSLAMVEAAAHGRPVVATDDPAVQEAADCLDGALVVPATDYEALGAGLARLLDDDALATELGARARAATTRLHAIRVVTAATRRVYRSALVGARR